MEIFYVIFCDMFVTTANHCIICNCNFHRCTCHATLGQCQFPKFLFIVPQWKRRSRVSVRTVASNNLRRINVRVDRLNLESGASRTLNYTSDNQGVERAFLLHEVFAGLPNLILTFGPFSVVCVSRNVI